MASTCSEFRLIGWRAGLRSHAEWSRNSKDRSPNTYERCRELMRNNRDDYPMFVIEEKTGSHWCVCDVFG